MKVAVDSVFSAWNSYSYNSSGISFRPRSESAPSLGLGLRPGNSVSEPEMRVPAGMYAVADARPIRLERAAGGQPVMSPYRLDPQQETPPPHKQAYDVVFADAHVELVKRKDYLYPLRTAHHWNRDNQPHPEVWSPPSYWVVSQ